MSSAEHPHGTHPHAGDPQAEHAHEGEHPLGQEHPPGGHIHGAHPHGEEHPHGQEHPHAGDPQGEHAHEGEHPPGGHIHGEDPHGQEHPPGRHIHGEGPHGTHPHAGDPQGEHAHEGEHPPQGGHIHGEDPHGQEHPPGGHIQGEDPHEGHAHGNGHGYGHGEHPHEEHGHAHGEHEHEHGSGSGLWQQLQHLVAPHSHDHADSLDEALTSTSDGIRAVQLSLVGLAITAAFQLIIALTSGSVAVLADTIHNFADASTAIPLWLAFAIGRKPANERYTYGYGRAEDLAGVFVLLMIVASAAVAAWESIQKLLQPTPIQNVGWVAIAALVGFLGNELVAQYRIRTGQRIGSAALVADGYHARTDGLTSLSVLLGAAGVWLGFPIADPIIGLLITIAILLVLKDSALQMWRRLMDAVDPELIKQATHAAEHADGVLKVSTVRARWIGHTIHAEALIVADGSLSLSEGHRVAEQARHAMLHAVPRLSSVTVHVDPTGDGLDHHAELAHHDRYSIDGEPASLV